MCIFNVTSKLRVVLQCINRDNRLIVVFKWVLISGYLAADTVHTNTVKTNKGYVETVPKFFLELRQDALQSDYQHSLGTSTFHQFCKQNTNFDSFTQTNSISNQQTWTCQLQSLHSGLQLVVGNIERCFMSNSYLFRPQRIVADIFFNEQSGQQITRTSIWDEMKLLGVNDLDILVQIRIEIVVLVFHQLR